MSHKIIGYFTSSKLYIIMLFYLAFGTLIFIAQGSGHNVYEYIASLFTNKKYICTVIFPTLFVLSTSLYHEMSSYPFLFQRFTSRKQILFFYIKNILGSSFIFFIEICLLAFICLNLFGNAAYEIVPMKIIDGNTVLYSGLNLFYLLAVAFRFFCSILCIAFLSLFLQLLFRNSKLVIGLEIFLIMCIYLMGSFVGPLYFTFFLPSYHLYQFSLEIPLFTNILLDLLYYMVVLFILYKGCLYLLFRKDRLVSHV